MNAMKIVKWELRKASGVLRWIVLPTLVVLLVAYLLPAKTWNSTALSGVFNALLAIGVGALVGFYPLVSMIFSLNGRYRSLEIMRSHPFVVTAVTKAIINILVLSLGWGILLLADEIFDNIYYVSSGLTYGLEYAQIAFYAALLSPTVVMFAMITASSVPVLKNYPTLSALGVGAVTFAAIFFIGTLLGTGGIIVHIAVVFVLFAVSCWLYDNRYEITSP